MSLSESLSAAFDSAPETPAMSAESFGTNETAATSETPEITGGLIGISDEPENPTQDGDSPVGAWKPTEGFSPETVVGVTEDGKPITVADLQRGALMQSDYTRKTQELAAQRKEHEESVAIATHYRPFIQALESGDPDTQRAAILEAAQALGVDIAPQRTRDELGRFASTPQEQDKIDLEDFIEGTPEYNMAVLAKSSMERTAALESKLDQILGRVQQETQKQQTEAAVSHVAQEWASKGFTKADVQGAMGLVGKQISPEQAMLLHHFEALMRHNLTQARAPRPVPNEPGTVNRSASSAQGKGLGQFLSETIR